jgi:hypothetical protein
MLGAQIEAAHAAAHTEGMLGAIDLFTSVIAERSGIEYAASGKVREALDVLRDEQRRVGAAQHQQRLQAADQEESGEENDGNV